MTFSSCKVHQMLDLACRYAREIRELKDTLNSTRRQLDDVRSELKRQNSTIAKVTSQVKCKNIEQVYFKRQNAINCISAPFFQSVFTNATPQTCLVLRC